MKKLEWKESYSVSIDEIDKQHKHLFKIFNKLIDNMDSDVNSKIIVDTLTEMTRYACYHFETEEKYMKEFGFTDSEQHKKEHVTFVKSISKLNFDAMENSNSVPEETLTYLGNWIITHTLESDMELKPFFFFFAQKKLNTDNFQKTGKKISLEAEFHI